MSTLNTYIQHIYHEEVKGSLHDSERTSLILAKPGRTEYSKEISTRSNFARVYVDRTLLEEKEIRAIFVCDIMKYHNY